MTDSTLLTNCGFRVLPRHRGPDIANVLQRAGYEIRLRADETWVRRPYRRYAATKPIDVEYGPVLTRGGIDHVALGAFLYRYLQGVYGKEQGRYSANLGRLESLVARAAAEQDLHRRCTLLMRALTFASPLDIRNVLVRNVLPVFFDLDPEAIVLPVLLNDELEPLCAVARVVYALAHATPTELQGIDEGVPSLRLWDQAAVVHFIDLLLSIIQVISYPNISLVKGGPYGLRFVFIFSKPPAHVPLPFPSSWLNIVRSYVPMADEQHDYDEIIRDPSSDEARKVAHGRHLATTYMPQADVHSLTRWAISNMADRVRELSDPANFLDQEHRVDPVFAFEHMLSWLRIVRQTVRSLATEEMPQGKLAAFDVADGIDGLSVAFARGKKQTGETFRLLFNPGAGRLLLQNALDTLPTGPRERLRALADALYGDLRATIAESVWIPRRRTDTGFLVPRRDATSDVEEPVDDFVANVMRALRNTHHGYMTRLDPWARPSRYLAMSTGNTPRSMATLPLIWTCALLADPTLLTGWEPLPSAAFPDPVL